MLMMEQSIDYTIIKFDNWKVNNNFELLEENKKNINKENK